MLRSKTQRLLSYFFIDWSQERPISPVWDVRDSPELVGDLCDHLQPWTIPKERITHEVRPTMYPKNILRMRCMRSTRYPKNILHMRCMRPTRCLGWRSVLKRGGLNLVVTEVVPVGGGADKTKQKQHTQKKKKKEKEKKKKKKRL